MIITARSNAALKHLFVCVLLLPIIHVHATHADKQHRSPQEIINQDFWGILYKNGGETYYCNKPFSKPTPLIAPSYIYPRTKIREVLQCGTKRRCLSESERYRIIISDLRNIVPADAYFEFKRQNSEFGILGEKVQANPCGIRKKLHIIEPPDKLKGDIARTLLYMSNQYQLPVLGNIHDLEFWTEQDPPSKAELNRLEAVETLRPVMETTETKEAKEAKEASN